MYCGAEASDSILGMAKGALPMPKQESALFLLGLFEWNAQY